MLSEAQELAAEVLARHMALIKYDSVLMDDARFLVQVITPILADTPHVEVQVEECAEPQQKVKCPCGKHIHPLYEKGYRAGAKTNGITLEAGHENNPLYGAGYVNGNAEGRRDGALEALRAVRMMLLDGNWSRKQQPGIDLAVEIVRQERFISCGVKE